jgi:hypothetical protein
MRAAISAGVGMVIVSLMRPMLTTVHGRIVDAAWIPRGFPVARILRVGCGSHNDYENFTGVK